MIPAVMPTYQRAEIAFERGRGGVSLCHRRPALSRFRQRHRRDGAGPLPIPHLVAALTEQAAKLWHTSNLYRRFPASSGWPSGWWPRASPTACSSANSGAEAIECGLKMVAQVP